MDEKDGGGDGDDDDGDIPISVKGSQQRLLTTHQVQGTLSKFKCQLCLQCTISKKTQMMDISICQERGP